MRREEGDPVRPEGSPGPAGRLHFETIAVSFKKIPWIIPEATQFNACPVEYITMEELRKLYPPKGGEDAGK